MDAASSATSPTPCSATSPSERVAWRVGPTPSQRERFRAALRRHCLKSRLLTSSSSSPSSSSSSSPSAPQLRVPDAINVAHHHFNGEEQRSSSVASPDVGAQGMPKAVIAPTPKSSPGQPAGAGASSAATSARPAKKIPASVSDKRSKQQQQPAPLAKATSATLNSTKATSATFTFTKATSATLASTSPCTLLSQHSPNSLTIAPLSSSEEDKAGRRTSSLAHLSSGHCLPRQASEAPLLLPTAPVEWPAPRKLRKVEEEAEGVVDHGILPLPLPTRGSHDNVGSVGGPLSLSASGDSCDNVCNVGGPLSVSDCCSLLQVPMPVTGGKIPPVGNMEGARASSPASPMPAGRESSSLATPGLQGGLLPDPVLEPPSQTFRHSDGGAPLPGAFVAAASASSQYNEKWRQNFQQQKLEGGSAAVLLEFVELKQAAEATLRGNPKAAQAGILPVTLPASGWMTWAAGEQSEPEEPSSGDTAGPFLPPVWRQAPLEAQGQPAANHHQPGTGLQCQAGAPAAAPLTPLWRHEGANGSGTGSSVQGTQVGPDGGVRLPCLETLPWRLLESSSVPRLQQAHWLMPYAGSGARIQSATGTSPFCGTPDQLAGPSMGMSNLVGPPGTFEVAMGVRRGAEGDFSNATASAFPGAVHMSQWPGTWAAAHPGACELARPEPGWMQHNSHHRPVPEALFISGSGPAAAAWMQRQGPGDLSASVCQEDSPGGTRTPVTRGDHCRVTPCLDTGHGLVSHVLGLEGGRRSDAVTNAAPWQCPLGQVDMGRQGEPPRQAANGGVMGLTGCFAPCQAESAAGPGPQAPPRSPGGFVLQAANEVVMGLTGCSAPFQADSAVLTQPDSAAGPGGSVLQAGKGGDVDEAGGSHHGSATYLSSKKEEGEEGTEEEPQGDKKIKRLMSNRASAKRSRERKQDRLQELEVASAKLRVEQIELQRQLEGANNTLESYKRKNDELRDELHELKAQARGKNVKLTS